VGTCDYRDGNSRDDNNVQGTQMNHTLADLIDIAQKSGTLPMQGLMLLAIIIIGLVFRSYYHDSQRNQAKQSEEHRCNMERVLKRLDDRETAMGTERVNRINMLMEILREDTTAKQMVASAVQNNTAAIGELRELIGDTMRDMRELFNTTIEITLRDRK
jgi:hypothetical protein